MAPCKQSPITRSCGPPTLTAENHGAQFPLRHGLLVTASPFLRDSLVSGPCFRSATENSSPSTVTAATSPCRAHVGFVLRYCPPSSRRSVGKCCSSLQRGLGAAQRSRQTALVSLIWSNFPRHWMMACSILQTLSTRASLRFPGYFYIMASTWSRIHATLHSLADSDRRSAWPLVEGNANGRSLWWHACRP